MRPIPTAFLFTLPVFLACGTTASSPPPPSTTRYMAATDRVNNCQYIQNRRNLATSVSAATSVLGGVSGIATLADQPTESKTALAIGGLVLGMMGAISAVYSKDLSESYETRGCKEVYQDWMNAGRELPIVISLPATPPSVTSGTQPPPPPPPPPHQ